MYKLKSIKKISKRFALTKKGKVTSRKCGQGHFNSRESGNITRNKRRDIENNPDVQSTKTLKMFLSI